MRRRLEPGYRRRSAEILELEFHGRLAVRFNPEILWIYAA
jgi:hypothetical protein